MKVSWFMNKCRRRQETIALMVAGLCPKADERRANDHLQECARCRAYFRELTEITAGMVRLKKAGAKAVPGAELSARWMDQVLEGVGTTERGSVTPASPNLETASVFQRAAAHRAAFRPAWLGWGLATAAGVLLAFFIGHQHGRTAPGDPLENVKMIRETLAMFPNRVQAIVEDEHGVNLVLSDSNNVPVSAPLYIHVCDGRHCSSYLTFSGQEITVGGQKVTVLEDTRGGVILAGNQFVWSNAGRTEAGDHWQIQAKNLSRTVM